MDYDSSDDDASNTEYPSCVRVTVPGGTVFEDETTAFPSADGSYPYALGVFIDFRITITRLEMYPTLYDYRTDGRFGESNVVTGLTVDEREIHNGITPDLEGIFYVHVEQDLYTNVSVVVSDVQLNAGAGAVTVASPPAGVLNVRYNLVRRSSDSSPFQTSGDSMTTDFLGTYSVYNSDVIDSYTYSNSLGSLLFDGTRGAGSNVFGRPMAIGGRARTATWLVVIRRSGGCSSNYMTFSAHATHESIRGECYHSDDCIREDNHPSGRKDNSDNNDETRFTRCIDLPWYDLSRGGRVMPQTRCVECTTSHMCKDGQYCQVDAGICENANGEYICDEWAHSSYGMCKNKENPGRQFFGKQCKAVGTTIYRSTFAIQDISAVTNYLVRGGDAGKFTANDGFCGDARFWNSTAQGERILTDRVARDGFARSILWAGVCYRGECMECDPDLTVTSAESRTTRQNNAIPIGKHCLNGRIVATTVVDNTFRSLGENLPVHVGIAFFTFFLVFLILFCFNMTNSTNSHRELFGEAPMSCCQWLFFVFCPFSCCCGTPSRIGTGIQTSAATGKPVEHDAAAQDSTKRTTTTKQQDKNVVPPTGAGFTDGAQASSV